MRWQLAQSFPRIRYLVRWGAAFSRMPLPCDEGELRQLCDQVAAMARDYFSAEAWLKASLPDVEQLALL